MIIIAHNQMKLCLEGSIIELPRDNARVFDREGNPTEDFKSWMIEVCGYYAKTSAAYTIHNMGWCVLNFVQNRKGHITVLVRDARKIPLIKLAWH